MRRVRPLMVAAILALWMAPNAAALAVAIHLLIDDHHALAQAGGAGAHGHDVVASAGHDHEIVQSRRNPAPRPAIADVDAPAATRSLGRQALRTWAPDIHSTSSPPAPLFLFHCTLLI